MATPREYAEGIAGMLGLEDDVGQIDYLTNKIGDAVREEREACAKIADDYRKSATDSGVPQVILLGGAAQIIRNRIRERK